jgi:beta-lactamase superfamily II metal-dependent hydrolase
MAAMTDLIVRVYNVRFGDAILVTIPDTAGGHAVKRNILIDFGNALGTAGGADDVLGPIMDDIVARLAGDPLDLYVMTHEHLDHVQGLFYAHETLNKAIQVKQAWLTGSANPDYYKTHPEARKQKIAALAAYQVTSARLQATAARSPLVDALLATNDPSKTSNCVAYLRPLVTPANLHYVDRTTDLSALQPATSATISLWAPEEDTADYYGTFKPLAAALQIGEDTSYDDLGLEDTPVNPSDLPYPPRGVDAGAFYNLLDVRHTNSASSLLSIDQAANNTSVVMLLEWNGWKLLFSGDAEKRSWKTMDAKGLVQPVHFLKVSHHGSHTPGTLSIELKFPSGGP